MKKTIEVEEETLPAVIAAVRVHLQARRDYLRAYVDDSSMEVQRKRRECAALEDALAALEAQTTAK